MKNLSKLIVTAALTLLCATGISSSAQAANPHTVRIAQGQTYTSYDITGDGQPDEIYVEAFPVYYDGDFMGTYEGLAVYVNDELAYDLDEPFFEIKMRLYTLDNGKPYLYLDAFSDDFGVTRSALFEYRNGDLKSALDLDNYAILCGVGQDAKVTSVDDNTLTIKYSFMSYSLGRVSTVRQYTYDDGKLVLSSGNASRFDRVNGERAPQSFKTRSYLYAYKDVGSSEPAFDVKPNKTVRIDKCAFTGNYMYFRVKYKGKYGWVRASSNPRYTSNGVYSRQFKNLFVMP